MEEYHSKMEHLIDVKLAELNHPPPLMERAAIMMTTASSLQRVKKRKLL
jgi:hypothetical protein